MLSLVRWRLFTALAPKHKAQSQMLGTSCHERALFPPALFSDRSLVFAILEV